MTKKNIKYIIVLLPLLHGCVISEDVVSKKLTKVENIEQTGIKHWKIYKTVYSRNGGKILVTAKNCYENESKDFIEQKVFIKKQLLVQLIKHEETTYFSTYPSDEYKVEFSFNQGNLNALMILKNAQYIEMFKGKNGLLEPGTDAELKKLQEVSSVVKGTLESLVDVVK